MEENKIQKLLDKNEEYKKKWLQLTEDDLFNRLVLQDEMITESSKLKSKYLEEKLLSDKEKALRSIELKATKDESWKGITEKVVDSIIRKEFYEKDLDQLATKATYELLYQRAQTITEYINIVKMNNRK